MGALPKPKTSIRLHKLPDKTRWAELKQEIASRRERYLREREGKPFTWCKGLATLSWHLACYDVLEGVDADAATHFDDAGRWACEALRDAPVEPGTWAPYLFDEMLFSAIAFGSCIEVAPAAGVPEEVFHSPGVIGSPESYLLTRAFQAWLRREDVNVSRLLDEILATPELFPTIAAEAAALRAIVNHDAPAVRDAVHGVVVAAKRSVRYLPSPVEGVVCRNGIALCRMARTVGIEVEDQIYLPTRLLPTEPIR